MTFHSMHGAAALLILAVAMATGAAAAETSPKDIYAPGARNGPFVASTRSLGELAKDGFEVRGNLGNALILQKGPAIYSCAIPPDPDHLSYRSYFVCSELREEFGYPDSASAKPDMPRLEMKKPQR